MEVILYEALFNRIARAIEAQRPELIAAHTKRYHDKIAFPYNANKPLPSNKLTNTRADLDYDVRGSGVKVAVTPEEIKVDISIDAAVSRVMDGINQEARFQLASALAANFDKPNETKYPLHVTDANIKGIQPEGFGTSVSWLMAEAAAATAKESGLPFDVKLFDGKVTIRFSTPALRSHEIRITGTIT